MLFSWNRVAPRHAPDGVTPDATTKALEKTAESIEAMNEKLAKIETDTAEKLATMAADHEKDLAKARAEAARSAKVQGALANRYGDSGKDDFLMDFAKFIRAGYRRSKGLKVEGELLGQPMDELMGKAVVDFTTEEAASAAYLIPTLLMPGIREIQRIHGNFYPKVTRATVPAGQTIHLPKDAARPTAYWRGTQLTGLTEEATPMEFGRGEISTDLLGTFIQLANELVNNPNVNASAVFVSRMLDGINRAVEFGMIQGTTGAGAPSDGIIADATDQGTLATMSFANLVTFLQSCIADNEYAFSTDRNVIVMTPADILGLATEAVGSSELTSMLTWGDPRRGIPPMVLGYEIMAHPAADNGSKHVLLGDPSTITLGEDPAFSIDFSQHAGTAFTENATVLRVLNHYDWDLGIAAEWHKAVVTA